MAVADLTHPLVAAAGIDDPAFNRSLQESCGLITAPDLTFAYDSEGAECVPSHTETPLCEDTPAVYREQFCARWAATGRDPQKCWDRLVSLNRETAIPGNVFCERRLWVLGVIPEMPRFYRCQLDQINKEIREYQQRQAEITRIVAVAAETGKRQKLRSWMTHRCCNGNHGDCSQDAATEYVYPDGHRKTEFTCTY